MTSYMHYTSLMNMSLQFRTNNSIICFCKYCSK